MDASLKIYCYLTLGQRLRHGGFHERLRSSIAIQKYWAGLPYSLAHVYRCGTSSTISNEDIASMSFLTRFHRFRERKRSRPLRPRMRFCRCASCSMSNYRGTLLGNCAGMMSARFSRRGGPGLKNGELLRMAADAGFDVFVTADRNLEFQQNLSQTGLGVIC